MKKFIQQIFGFILFTCLTCSLFSQDVITISEARETDAEGSLVRLGDTVELEGISIGPNFRVGGQTWSLVDTSDNLGITVFAFNNDVGYDVTDGDHLKVIGELAEFNGLAEIIPTSIEILSQGNPVPSPNVVVEVSEINEATLITIENVSLVDVAQWSTGSFNVDVTDGNTNFQVRIDSDINISGMPAPQGTFNITGIVGQFDNEAPYFDGYQIFPRSVADIDPYDTGMTGGPSYEAISIEQAREVDGDLASTRVGDLVEVTGVVHGINFRPSGLQFSLINDNNVGIGIFASNNDIGYAFNESDELTVKGRVDQFNGLTQIVPDSIFLLSTNNILQFAAQKTTLDETTESSLTSITMTGWVDVSQWQGDGSSFNAEFNTATGEVLTVRVDSDSPWANQPAPDGFSIVTGIGGQFDNSAPFDSGYQLLVYSDMAFQPYLSNENLYEGSVDIFPNPTTTTLNIKTDEDYSKVEMFNAMGQLVIKRNNYSASLNTSDLETGVYFIKLYFEEAVHIQQVIVE